MLYINITIIIAIIIYTEGGFTPVICLSMWHIKIIIFIYVGNIY